MSLLNWGAFFCCALTLQRKASCTFRRHCILPYLRVMMIYSFIEPYFWTRIPEWTNHVHILPFGNSGRDIAKNLRTAGLGQLCFTRILDIQVKAQTLRTILDLEILTILQELTWISRDNILMITNLVKIIQDGKMYNILWRSYMIVLSQFAMVTSQHKRQL